MAVLPPIAPTVETTARDLLAVANIPPTVLANVVDLGERHRLPTVRWLAGTGLDAERLAAPTTKVSYRQAATILRRALRDFGPGPVGMAVGGRGALEGFGILGAVMASCRTFGDAAALGVELHLSAGSIVDVELEGSDDAGGEIVLRLHERSPEPALLPFLCEEAFTSTLLFWRTFLGPRFDPSWVELSYPRPAWAAAYTRYFRCPVTYGAPAIGMAFPASYLDLALPTYDRDRLDSALSAARGLIDPGAVRPDTVVVVENLLRSNVAAPPTLAEVAAELGTSERTLRRQLAASGTGFAGLRDDVRRRRAEELLRRGSPVGVVSAALGFSEPREFRRAFKRWTGVVPRSLHPAPRKS